MCAFLPSRRHFLLSTFEAATLAPLVIAQTQHDPPEISPGAVVVTRIQLDSEFYDAPRSLNGQIFFREAPAGPIVVRWVDSSGRVAGELALEAPKPPTEPLRFSFRLADGLTTMNWIEVAVDGARQIETAKFLLSRAEPWDDFHAIVWAFYPEGFYGLLGGAGVDSTIAYHDNDFSYVLDNNFRFYVEQMAPDVFSLYHNQQKMWRSLINSYATNRDNWKLLIRKPCINDPNTDAYLRERLTRTVRQHRAGRPLYYNIADELGHGDQIQPFDFCHCRYCTAKFAEYLRALYGTTDRVAAEWGGRESGRWDDELLRSDADWSHDDLMIGRTTTDQAFDEATAAALQTKYESVRKFNQVWGTPFPEPAYAENTSPEQWQPLLGVLKESRSAATLDAHTLEQRLGDLRAANARWGWRGGWTTEGKPVGFRSWEEVAAFVKRFYPALAEIDSTEGWNLAPWCDFRNFMDQTFADAVVRGAAVCKAEDPEARCATEGGQAPAAFGWYNYEQVTRADDVIEPYNIGNNVEIARSLKPEMILLATHGFGHHPGKPLTARDRVAQQAISRALWWQLFHGHRGAIIWDNHDPNFELVDRKTGQSTASADAFRDTFLELRGGIAKLIIHSRRLHDGIAIHYSHPSLQVHWVLENLKHAREWPTSHENERGSRFVAVRNSWTKLIEDLGYQYNFLSRLQIEAGKLGGGEYRVLILPESVALSEREADAIHDFVRSGGLLVADFRAATMNEHGRDLGRGQLDDIFGIRHGARQPGDAAVVGVADERELRLAGRQLARLSLGERAIELAGGRALAISGRVPAVITHNFGDGRAVFLNLNVAGYAYQRLHPQADSSALSDIVQGIFANAQMQPPLQVLGRDGKRLPGTEVVRFANGDWEHVAIFRNPQFDDGGWQDYPTLPAGEWAGEIDNSLLESPAEVRLQWPNAQPTYAIRGRKQLGNVQSHEAVLDPWSPLVFTRAARPIGGLAVELPAQRAAGSELALTLSSEQPLPEGAVRVVRVEFFTPAGSRYDLYSRNIVLRGGSHLHRLRLAFNDPKGRWRLRTHDVLTGDVIERAFEVS